MSHFIPWPTKKDISECAWKVLEKGALELGSVLVLHRLQYLDIFCQHKNEHLSHYLDVLQ